MYKGTINFLFPQSHVQAGQNLNVTKYKPLMSHKGCFQINDQLTVRWLIADKVDSNFKCTRRVLIKLVVSV